MFLASHASGHLYLYNEELPCTPAAPNYQNFKTGDGFTILTCKSKSTRNPLYKWTFSTENCSINEFCFSPCGSMLAIVSQDGFLRVFHYDTMELLGLARSYFGGFLCVCWSPDAKYIVVGGEDDLVTVWSLHERRVVARGQGHRSWVSVVAFDPFTSYSHCDSPDFSDDEIAATSNDISYNGKLPSNAVHADAHGKHADGENIPANSRRTTRNSCRNSLAPSKLGTSYRLGSVGQDTQLCLWDITEDILRQSYEKRHRLGSHDPQLQPDDPKIAKSMSSKTGGNKVDSMASNKTETDSNYKCSKISSNPIHGNDIGASVSAAAHCSNSESNKYSNSSNKFSGKTIVMENCVDTIIGNSSLTNNDSVASTMPNDVSVNSKSSSGKSSTESGMTALNTITQRLSSFSFINEKKSSGGSGTHSNSHKKAFTFSKSSGNNSSFLCNSGNNGATGSDLNGSAASLKNAKNAIASFDPMKLIGTNACPRFDECPLLEPLVCKKIAHERLTALIFREDCFLTACQDGFIYTWARPGFSVCTCRNTPYTSFTLDRNFSGNITHSLSIDSFQNIPQHNLTNSPTPPTGGTVV